MKNMIMVFGLIATFAVSPLAVSAIAAEEGGDHSSVVEALVEEGVAVEEAESIVAQAVEEAKKEGLTGKDLSAKIHEAVEAAKAAKAAEHSAKSESAEHPAKTKSQENPSQAKPKDHPAH